MIRIRIRIHYQAVKGRAQPCSNLEQKISGFGLELGSGLGLGSGFTIRHSRGTTFLKLGMKKMRSINQDLKIRIKESRHINQDHGANE